MAACQLDRIKTQTCPIFRERRGAKRLGEVLRALSPPEALDEFDGVLAGVNLQLAAEAAHVGAHGVVARIELAGDTTLAVSLGKGAARLPRARSGSIRPQSSSRSRGAARSE